MELQIKTYRLDQETIYLIEKYADTYGSKGKVIRAALGMLHRAELEHLPPMKTMPVEVFVPVQPNPTPKPITMTRQPLLRPSERGKR